MRYRVLLTQEALRSIEQFPVAVQQDVATQLARLGEEPHLAMQLLSGLYEGKRVFRFRVTRSPLTFIFTALWEYSDDGQDIVVQTFGVMRGDPPQLPED